MALRSLSRLKTKPYNLFIHKRCSASASATADIPQKVSSEYDKARPFSQIPGPKSLPFIGTMLQYRKGIIFVLLHVFSLVGFTAQMSNVIFKC